MNKRWLIAAVFVLVLSMGIRCIAWITEEKRPISGTDDQNLDPTVDRKGREFDLLKYGRGCFATVPEANQPAGAEDFPHFLKVVPFP
jgi:hypothetical protein